MPMDVRVIALAAVCLAPVGFVSAAAAQHHAVVPFQPMGSEQNRRTISGDPDKPGAPFVIHIGTMTGKS